MLKPEEQRIVEACKRALLKQCREVRYNGNNYPIEAVPKTTILGLEFLVKSELDREPPKTNTDSIQL